MPQGMKFSMDARVAFVDAVVGGSTLARAAALVGASERTGTFWWLQSGGMRVKQGRGGGGVDDPAVRDGEPGDRFLTLAERAMIQFGRRKGLSYSEITDRVDVGVLFRR